MARLNRAERLSARLDRLDRLNEGKHAPYKPAVLGLRTWHAEGSDVRTIRIRKSFVTGEPSPVSQLIHGGSHALRLALITLFLAQSRKGGHRHILRLPLTAREPDDLAWADLVVSGSKEGTGSASRRPPQKRAASARAALNRLSRPDICLIEPPSTARRLGRFDELRLLQDSGPRAIGPPVPYSMPRPNEVVVQVPVEFFLNGWIFALEDSEIATYLMYRLVCANGPGHVSASFREEHFGIKASAWEQHWVLVDSGILHLVPDPNRRDDGTYIDQSDGANPQPHVFSLRDDGLKEDGLTKVWEAVENRHASR